MPENYRPNPGNVEGKFHPDAETDAEVDLMFNSIQKEETGASVDQAFEGIQDKTPDSVRRITDLIRDAQIAETGRSGEHRVISEAVLKEMEKFGVSSDSDPISVAQARERKRAFDVYLAKLDVGAALEGKKLELADHPYEFHSNSDKFDLDLMETKPGEYMMLISGKNASEQIGKRFPTEHIPVTFHLDKINSQSERNIYLQNLMEKLTDQMATAESITSLGEQVRQALGHGTESSQDRIKPAA